MRLRSFPTQWGSIREEPGRNPARDCKRRNAGYKYRVAASRGRSTTQPQQNTPTPQKQPRLTTGLRWSCRTLSLLRGFRRAYACETKCKLRVCHRPFKGHTMFFYAVEIACEESAR